MKAKGYTLVEVLLVITIIGIMASIASYQFSQYMTKSAIESQTRQIYTDMIEQRSKALFEKRSRGVKITTTSFSLYSSDVTTVTPIAVTTLKYPVNSDNYTDVIFDVNGMLDSVSNQTICVTESNSASINSVVISETRIRLGKLKEGTSCVSTNIYAK